ncbi:CC0125/CC1285 family lipoprotein [Noviherbaspirillum sp. ST9]|uniref:CC0125/CC1285 family lipoprotein n=1 Tax=Noviherbaspirillum sp. ST9 TaxID=3401606 RepID=UPI003B587BBB
MHQCVLIAALAAAVLGGCATTYQDARNPFLGMAGGYWDLPGPGELIKVGFSGNSYIERDKVSDFLLRRCAELTKKSGKEYFALYKNLPDAVQDKRSARKVTTTIIGKPNAHVYILTFDKDGSGLLNASEILERFDMEARQKEVPKT